MGIMRLKIIKASAIPSVLTVLILLTVVVLTCSVLHHRNKSADQRFHKKVIKQALEVVRLVERSDKIPPEYYHEFIEFAEKIMHHSCDTCHSSTAQTSFQGEGQGVGQGAGLDQVDGRWTEGGDEVTRMEEGRSNGLLKVVGAMVRIVEKGLKNQTTGIQLSRELSKILPPTEDTVLLLQDGSINSLSESAAHEMSDIQALDFSAPPN